MDDKRNNIKLTGAESASISVDSDQLTLRQDRLASGIDGTVRRFDGNNTDGNPGAVAEMVPPNGHAAIIVPTNNPAHSNGPTVDNKRKLVHGRPWKYPGHVEALLADGWLPTRWEKNGVVAEYPVQGGIKTTLPDGSVHELSPDGVLTLPRARRIMLTNNAGDVISLDREESRDEQGNPVLVEPAKVRRFIRDEKGDLVEVFPDGPAAEGGGEGSHGG